MQSVLLGLALSLFLFSPNVSGNEKNCDDLSCYLRSVTLLFPPISYKSVDPEISVTLNNLRCFDVSIGVINSSVQTDDSKSSLNFHIESPVLRCESDWELHAKHIATQFTKFDDFGVLTAEISPDTRMDLTVDLRMEDIEREEGCMIENVPTSLFLFNCEFPVRLKELTMTSSHEKFQEIIDNMLPDIKGVIEGLSGFIFCTEFASFLETKATTSISDYAHNVIVPNSDCKATTEKSQSTKKSSGFTSLFRSLLSKKSKLDLLDPTTKDLRTIPLLDTMAYIFNDILAEEGSLPLSTIIDLFLVNGEFSFKDQVVQINENIILNLKAFKTKGLNTLQVPFFEEIRETSFDNMLAINSLSVSTNMIFDMLLPSEFLISFNSEKNPTSSDSFISLSEKLSLSTSIQHILFRFLVSLLIDSEKLGSLNPSQAKDANCLSSTLLPGTSFLSLEGKCEIEELTLTAPEYPSESLEEYATKLLNDFVLWVQPYDPFLKAIITDLLEIHVKPKLNEFINTQVLGGECDGSIQDIHSITLNTSMTIKCTIVVFSVCFVILVLLIWIESVLRKKKVTENIDEKKMLLWDDKVNSSLENDEEIVEKSNERQIPHSSWANSLVFHPRINVVARFGIVVLIFGDVCLFFSSNVSFAAVVSPVIYPSTEKNFSLIFPSMFNFNLKNSVVDMWDAGVYPLSILVLLFSGIWPYLKLFLLLLCWMLPRKVISIKKREFLLMALDALGKWSLIDSFMMVAMVVAFRFRVEFPQHSSDISAQFVAGIIVQVVYGMTAFLSATVLSLILSHSCVALHRNAEKPSKNEGDVNSISVATCFVRSQKKRWVGLSVGIGIPLLLLATLLILFAGIFVYSFRFVFLGAAGFALNLLNIPNDNSYSLYSLAIALPKYAPSYTLPSVIFVDIMFIATVVVFPIVHIIILVFLWLFPLRRKHQRRLYVAVEVLNAWSAIEVYVLILIVMLLEIQQFAGFIVKDTCKDINPFLDKYFAPLLGEGNTACFEVNAYLLPGVWCFFAASVLYIVSSMVVMRSCHSLLRQREKDEVLDHDEKQETKGLIQQ